MPNESVVRLGQLSTVAAALEAEREAGDAALQTAVNQKAATADLPAQYVARGGAAVTEAERRTYAGTVPAEVNGAVKSVPLLRFQGDPRLSWFKDLAEDDGGAAEDWHPAFEKLMVEAVASGRNRALVDYRAAPYVIRNAVRLRDRVELAGVGGRALIKNPSAYADGFCLHAGWAHEADWGFVDSWALDSYVGNVATFSDAVPDDVVVGEPLVVAINDFSEQSGANARNSVCNVMARVVAIDGLEVTLDERAEAVATSWDPSLSWGGASPGVHPNGGGALELRATKLEGHSSLGHSTFIVDSPVVKNLAFESTNASWAVRSAVYNGRFEGIHVVNSGHIGGGNFQARCLFRDVTGSFRSKAFDVAEGCYKTVYDGFDVALHPDADRGAVASALVALRGQCEIRNARIDGADADWQNLVLGRTGSGSVIDSHIAGRATAGVLLADAQAAQDVGRFTVRGSDVDGRGGTAFKQLVALRSPNATVEGTAFRNGTFSATGARVAQFESRGGRVVRNRYLGGFALKQTVQSDATGAVASVFEDNFFDTTGQITMTAGLVPSAKIRLGGNYTREDRTDTPVPTAAEIGLGNVTNTSDAQKASAGPIYDAIQAAVAAPSVSFVARSGPRGAGRVTVERPYTTAVYVDAVNGAVDGDGSSWATAKNDLQAVLDELEDGQCVFTNATLESPFEPVTVSVDADDWTWVMDAGPDGGTVVSGARSLTFAAATGTVFSAALAAEPVAVGYNLRPASVDGRETAIDLTRADVAEALRTWDRNAADLAPWMGVMRKVAATTTPGVGEWSYTGATLYVNPGGGATAADVSRLCVYTDGESAVRVTGTVDNMVIGPGLTSFFTPKVTAGDGYGVWVADATDSAVYQPRAIMAGYHAAGFVQSCGRGNRIYYPECVGMAPTTGAYANPFVFYTNLADMDDIDGQVVGGVFIATPLLDTVGAPIHGGAYDPQFGYSHTDNVAVLGGVRYRGPLQIDFLEEQAARFGAFTTATKGLVAAANLPVTPDAGDRATFAVTCEDGLAIGRAASPSWSVLYTNCTFDRSPVVAVAGTSVVTMSTQTADWDVRLENCAIDTGTCARYFGSISGADRVVLVGCRAYSRAGTGATDGFLHFSGLADGAVTLDGSTFDHADVGSNFAAMTPTVYTAGPGDVFVIGAPNRFGSEVQRFVATTSGSDDEDGAWWVANVAADDVTGLQDPLVRRAAGVRADGTVVGVSPDGTARVLVFNNDGTLSTVAL